jgi:cytochrome c oxidase subunit 2
LDRLTEYLFPEQVSTFAQDIDNLFYFIFYASIVLLAIVTFGMIYLAIKYRFKKNDEVRLTSSIDHNSILESSFVIIPLILVSITFVWGIKSYLNMVTVPNDAIEMKITGQSWYWTWDYPDGGPSNVFSTAQPLVLPVNTPIKIVLSSTDVLHSFYIPVMRAKMDVLPNRYNVMWFDAKKVGEYSIFCTEYCGTQHSQMSGTVKIVPIKVYEKWLTEAGSEDDDLPLDELGAKLYTKKACITCHTLDGSALVGPSYLQTSQMWGQERVFDDGSSATIDDNYIRNSILEPQSQIVAGYQGVMPTYQGVLNDRELDALIAFLKTLKEDSEI